MNTEKPKITQADLEELMKTEAGRKAIELIGWLELEVSQKGHLTNVLARMS